MIDAFLALLTLEPMIYLAVGVALGIVIGAIPGLTATMLIALTLPPPAADFKNAISLGRIHNWEYL